MLLVVLDQPSRIDFAAVFWGLWRRRNELVWNAIARPSVQVLHEVRVLIHGWLNCHVQQQQQCRPIQLLQWQKPLSGRVKCNINGAWFEHESRCGIGVCLRDHLGSFLSAKTVWLNGRLTAPEIEAFGL